MIYGKSLISRIPTSSVRTDRESRVNQIVFIPRSFICELGLRPEGALLRPSPQWSIGREGRDEEAKSLRYCGVPTHESLSTAVCALPAVPFLPPNSPRCMKRFVEDNHLLCQPATLLPSAVLPSHACSVIRLPWALYPGLQVICAI